MANSAEKISVYNLAGTSLPGALQAQSPLRCCPALPCAALCCDLLTPWLLATTDLKNTSDDAIPNYLNSLKFKQSHFLTDVRLALGYSAFALAAACFLWDYKLGFQNTKHFTAAAVAVYTLINTALTLWITVREKGIVYEGAAPSGESV
ncbi:signal peptidase [Ilyonectria robusta]